MGRLAQSLKAYEGREVFLGIRPEHMGMVGLSDIPQGNNVVRGQVVVVESLGAQTDLIVDIAGQTVTAKLEGMAPVEPGDTIDLLIDQTRLHAFDTSTELAIDRGTPTGTRGQLDTQGLGYDYPSHTPQGQGMAVAGMMAQGTVQPGGAPHVQAAQTQDAGSSSVTVIEAKPR